ISETNTPFVVLEGCLQDQGIAAIAARCLGGIFGSDEPPAVLRLAEERGETGIGIKTRHAEPVDRAVTPDESRGLAVPDQRVILDAKRHRLCPALGNR